MVAEFFVRAGWDVEGGPLGRNALLAAVRGAWFDVVGLALSRETRIETLAADIRAVRRASLNRAVGVMVGGPLINEHPELVARVGADATAVDGPQAPVQAANMLARLAKCL